MVVIRLSRGGVKHKSFYSVRVADSRNSRDGTFLEKVGYFNPMARGQQKRLELNMERVDNWLARGAQPSDRVQRLIKDYRAGEEAVAAKRQATLEKKRIKVAQRKEQTKKEALESASAPQTAEE